MDRLRELHSIHSGKARVRGRWPAGGRGSYMGLVGGRLWRGVDDFRDHGGRSRSNIACDAHFLAAHEGRKNGLMLDILTGCKSA